MYKSYWGMEFNPFAKELSEKDFFSSEDFKQSVARLNHLKKIKGIGLFTGLSGTGKTYSLRYFKSTLNSSLFKAIYLPLSTLTVQEFYRSLCLGLHIQPPYKKIDMFNEIQNRILLLSKEKKVTPIIILDEAQYLNTQIINDLKIIINFEMDSENHIILVLCGQPTLNNLLSRSAHESIKQRIVIKYNYSGFTKEETEEYISTRLKLCGVSTNMFNTNTIEAIYGYCNGYVRVLNTVIEKSLMIGFQKKIKKITTDIVMDALNETELV